MQLESPLIDSISTRQGRICTAGINEPEDQRINRASKTRAKGSLVLATEVVYLIWRLGIPHSETPIFGLEDLTHLDEETIPLCSSGGQDDQSTICPYLG